MQIKWFKSFNIAEINQLNINSMVDFLKIEITDITNDYLEAIMPVSQNIKQPFGIVHGGANCVLAETVGSIASNMVLDPNKQHAVGLSISTNHIKAVRNGKISARAYAIHLGKKTHIWEIKTFNDNEELTSLTTLTMAVIEKIGH